MKYMSYVITAYENHDYLKQRKQPEEKQPLAKHSQWAGVDYGTYIP